jgi:hypothetical protein
LGVIVFVSAAYSGISIEQRACFNLTLSIQKNGSVYNLSGVNLTGVIRRDFDDELQAVFQTEILSTGSGIAKISLDGATTAAIDLSPCSWDLYADKESECPDKLMYGPVYLTKSRT